MHVTTVYVITPAGRADAVVGLADLVQFLSTAAEEMADPASWRSGGAVARATWERIVLEDPAGECREMKALGIEPRTYGLKVRCSTAELRLQWGGRRLGPTTY